MSADSDLQRPEKGANATTTKGSERPGESAGPGLKADALGGRATWIEASPGMRRSAENISMTDRRVARGLGWFSLGLGIPQVLMPGRVNKLAGLENTLFKRQVMRLMGLREITAGVGIFGSQPKPAEWLWARTAGDAVDLLLLQSAFRNPANRKGRLMFATANVIGVTAADVMQARKHTEALKASGEEGAMKARTSITVNKPPEEVYGYWKDFQNLPKFMFHLESVVPKGEDRTHWIARAPLGKRVEWDAEIVEDLPNELIAWKATEDADVPNSGSVRFVPAPGGRGTEVIVELDYQLPGGAIGDTIAMMFGEEPQQQIKDDLRRFKQVMETGEVMRSDGSPDGTASKYQLRPRPAQPLP
ncbi:MAG: SRPBCC family protein [Actinomycetota bacterium]